MGHEQQLSAPAQRADSMDYHCGVKPSEAPPQRHAYQGDASLNLDNGIQDSPLVDRSSTTGLRLGYLYRF